MLENTQFLNKKKERDAVEEEENKNKKKFTPEPPEFYPVNIENEHKNVIIFEMDNDADKEINEKENSKESMYMHKSTNEQTEKPKTNEEKKVEENKKEEKKETKLFVSEPNNLDRPTNNTDTISENNSKNSKKKREKKDKNEKVKEKMEKYLLKIKKGTKDREEALQKGYEKFKEAKYEWDYYFIVLLLTIENLLKNFQEFPEDFTYYIYNNLRGVKSTKEFSNIINNPPQNEKLYEEALKIFEDRKQIFMRLAQKYQIKSLQTYINKNIADQNKVNNNLNNLNNNNEGKAINKGFLKLTEDYQIELFIGSLVNCSLIRGEKDQEKYNKDFKKEKGINPFKVEASNFNISEESMIGVITGLKFYNNITEINISGNMLMPKALFWLGTIFKTNSNIKVLDLTRTNIDNDCLYLFIEGTKFSNESLNKEMLNLDKLILKDNNQITDISNNLFEHPLGLILRRFKIKWLNLTNAKLGNSGVCKFLKVYLSLMKENKIFMENLILICNAFGNEECLNIIGEIIQQKNSNLNNLVLSKNLISTPNPNQTPTVNYFENFMKSVVKSNLKELFLISCGIGKNVNDIQILTDMLCQNKSLTSLRLFGNEISKMEDFTRILGIFSEYKNGLKNTSLKSLDLSKNGCQIKIDEDFLELIEKLKLEYLDINQNMMDAAEKETFKKRTNELNDIKIIY